MKVQAHNSLEPPLGPDHFDESSSVITFLTISGVKEILCSFTWNLEEIDTSRLVPSRIEFLEMFLADNFILSDAEDNTSG